MCGFTFFIRDGPLIRVEFFYCKVFFDGPSPEKNIYISMGRAINDLGGLRQKICVDFFFPGQPADEFFFIVRSFFDGPSSEKKYVPPPQTINGGPLTSSHLIK